MRACLHVILMALAFVVGAHAQSKPAVSAPATAYASTVTEEVFYPLPPDRRGQVRELQYQDDQDEILIQKHQVEIEKLKAQQIFLRDSIASIGTDFARIKNLSIAEWDLDQVNLRLIKKKLPEKK